MYFNTTLSVKNYYVYSISEKIFKNKNDPNEIDILKEAEMSHFSHYFIIFVYFNVIQSIHIYNGYTLVFTTHANRNHS